MSFGNREATIPRNGADVYSLPAGSTVTNGDVSDATDINTPLADIAADLNIARAIVVGGTGATSASGARTNLAVPGIASTAAISGTWTWSVPAVFAAGTVGAPSIAFTGDSNTGFYAIGADNVGLSAGGVKVIDAAATGCGVVMAAGSAAAPSLAGTGDSNTGILWPAADTLGFTLGGVEYARLTSSGNSRHTLQSGGTASFPTGLGGAVQVQGLAGAAAVSSHRASADATGANFNASKSRGTTAGDSTIVQTADELGIYAFWGADGSTQKLAAYIQGRTAGTPALGDVRAEIRMFVGTASSPTATYVFGVDGSALSIHATGGIGYGTGAGGTVTQTTSKSTGVTINKVTGKITTHNAALSANSVVTFTVTNSAVAATDVVVTSIVTPAAKYTARVSATSAGSFEIMLANQTAGPLSEAVEINFAVIRGATS